jgi:hypothetical protein
MTTQPFMPDASVDRRLLDNLHRSHLEMEEIGLTLNAVIAKFDEVIRQQQIPRMSRSSTVQIPE